MRKIFTLSLLIASITTMQAQTPYQRVYQTLNTKCQNSTCHSATSSDALKFDGSENDVYAAIYNTVSSYASSASKSEKIIRPGHPYMSFLLRKVAGAGFDTDLAIDTATEGALMLDINGNQLTNKEIEFIRQWTMYGAKKGSTTQPNWQIISDYYDNPAMPFLPKPAKPATGTGLQVRMGPVFLPVNGEVEQEWMLQQEVNFPVLPEVDRIEGIMNQQSHHFLLFRFTDSLAAADRGNGTFGMEKVVITGANSFEGDKGLTGAWQDDADIVLPTGTAMFWPQKTYLDMNYHILNYNATAVLPCDFYINIYYKPRNPNTIEMKANLVNNVGLFLPQGNQTRDYADETNNDAKEWKYLWMISSHSHKYGTDYDIYVKDTTGGMTDKIYEGFYSYENNFDKGFYDWEHPSIRYWPDLYPVKFGKHGSVNAGLVARTSWNVQEPFVTFGFTSNDEMQLFYYMYTSQPLDAATAINDDTQKGIFLSVVPNPMNGNGKIVYTLENSAIVKASVTDITGKVVAELTQENQTEGTHEITIGNNENLSKGIYFANLSVNGTVYTRKFIVTE